MLLLSNSIFPLFKTQFNITIYGWQFSEKKRSALLLVIEKKRINNWKLRKRTFGSIFCWLAKTEIYQILFVAGNSIKKKHKTPRTCLWWLIAVLFLTLTQSVYKFKLTFFFVIFISILENSFTNLHSNMYSTRYMELNFLVWHLWFCTSLRK